MINILLVNPKYIHNIGGAVRALSCFGEGQVLWTGDRIDLGDRLPREERLKGYKDVKWAKAKDRPLSYLSSNGYTPIAIELLNNTEQLHTFTHPDRAVYVFGPEDGSLPPGIRRECHRFVSIPSKHCLNLAAAVYLVLYDRAVKA